MKELRYFRYAIGLSIIMFAALYVVDGSFALLITASVLASMELAVSFDNAIVNAKIMARMTPFWRQMFITVGIFIAVIGMRFYLPIQIVSLLGQVSFIDASMLAFNDPGKFSEILISSHTIVSGFGGAFLMLIFLKHFISAEREEHWIPGLEAALKKLHHLEEIQILIVMTFACFVGYYIQSTAFIVSALIGVLSHIAVDLIKEGLQTLDNKMQDKSESTAAGVATGGFGMFLYLELFDASMSFDGVIAAFAITNNILVVAVGLGVGAVFVRSLTLMLFDTGKLAEYRYLEAGAFWAIGGLSIFMFASVMEHIPDYIISGYGGLVIIAAWIHSVIANRNDAKKENVGLGLSESVDKYGAAG